MSCRRGRVPGRRTARRHAAALRNLSAPASPLTRLIEIGEFEAAVADALCPDTVNAALSALDSSTLPSPVVLRVSEGYAYYALCPQTYAAAALLFFDTDRPGGCQRHRHQEHRPTAVRRRSGLSRLSRAIYNHGVMSTEDRQAARARLADLVSLLRQGQDADQFAPIIDEALALDKAIAAFHLEGIRFRIYNVDRLVTHPPTALPPEATTIVADVRRHLEAAGFHTRSHQAPS